jgi:2Fe-2S ferredoxin
MDKVPAVSSQNPHIHDADVRLPTGKYTLRIVGPPDREHVIEVDPARIPYGSHGQPGSILDIALAHGVEIEHTCGGVGWCTTCHVIVKEGLDACNAASEAEEDRLDHAYGLTTQSRLACQCVPDGTREIVVVVPSWNRNLVSERH